MCCIFRGGAFRNVSNSWSNCSNKVQGHSQWRHYVVPVSLCCNCLCLSFIPIPKCYRLFMKMTMAHVTLITAPLGSWVTRWPSLNTKVEVLPFGVARRGHSRSSAMSLFDEWHLFLLSFHRNCISLLHRFRCSEILVENRRVFFVSNFIE